MVTPGGPKSRGNPQNRQPAVARNTRATAVKHAHGEAEVAPAEEVPKNKKPRTTGVGRGTRGGRGRGGNRSKKVPMPDEYVQSGSDEEKENADPVHSHSGGGWARIFSFFHIVNSIFSIRHFILK